MDQAGAGRLTRNEATLAVEGFTADQLLQERFALAHRHHGAARQFATELFVEHAHRTATEHGPGSGLEATGRAQTTAHQAQVAPKLAIERRHQPQAAEGTAQALDRIAGVEHLKGVLQRVTAAPIHRGIDLNVAPGEHQQRGLEPLDLLLQHILHIQQRHRRQIKDALLELRKLFVDVIGQVHRADRKDGIAGQAHQQHPLFLQGGLSHSESGVGRVGLGRCGR